MLQVKAPLIIEGPGRQQLPEQVQNTPQFGRVLVAIARAGEDITAIDATLKTTEGEIGSSTDENHYQLSKLMQQMQIKNFLKPLIGTKSGQEYYRMTLLQVKSTGRTSKTFSLLWFRPLARWVETTQKFLICKKAFSHPRWLCCHWESASAVSRQWTTGTTKVLMK